MFRNYLKIAVRNLLKFKVYSLINMAGLAVGMSCAILFYLFVRHEFSYDKFHHHAGQTYRVTQKAMPYFYGPGTRTKIMVPLPLGPALEEEYPQVKSRVRLMFAGKTVVKCGDNLYNDRPTFVDPNFFEFFSFPLRAGDAASSLKNPEAVVLSARVARKYFGGEAALGKNLLIKLGDEFTTRTVTAVAEDVPDNSSITFDILLPLPSNPAYADRAQNWNNYCCATYVRLDDHRGAAQLERSSVALMARHYREDSDQHRKAGAIAEAYSPPSVGLQPLTGMHLHPIKGWGLATSGSPVSPYVLGAIGLLILAIACINFTTLATGRAASRAAEIGTRKALGALRFQLVKQFLGETILLSFMALIAGLGLAELFLPTFNALVGTHLNLSPFDDGSLVVFLLSMAMFIGILAGSYPALVMSRFRVVEALAGKTVLGGRNAPLRGLVLIQFTLTAFLIVTAMVTARQLDFMATTDLGYDTDLLVTVPITGVRADRRDAVFDRYRTALLAHENIVKVTGVDAAFARGSSRVSWQVGEDKGAAYIYRIEYDYLRTLGIDVVEGRDFSREMPGDATGSVIVNEALVREFQLKSPVGRPLAGLGRGSMGLAADPTIIGVVRDYHFLSLRDSIGPAVLHVNPKYSLWYVLVRIVPHDVAGTMALLRHTWEDVVTDVPFEFSFVDEDVRGQYAAERRWKKIATYSSVVAIVIACLGLFGLSALATVRRTREIGIRKALGATVPGILVLLSREFVVLVGVANLLAWPVAYLTLDRWLTGFAYRMSLGPDVFLAAGVLTMMISLLAISYQAIKASLANPVETLKYE